MIRRTSRQRISSSVPDRAGPLGSRFFSRTAKSPAPSGSSRPPAYRSTRRIQLQVALVGIHSSGQLRNEERQTVTNGDQKGPRQYDTLRQQVCRLLSPRQLQSGPRFRNARFVRGWCLTQHDHSGPVTVHMIASLVAADILECGWLQCMVIIASPHPTVHLLASERTMTAEYWPEPQEVRSFARL